MKTIDSATQTEINKSGFSMVTLLTFYDIDGDHYFSDGPASVSHGGNTYIATNGQMGVSEINEAEDPKIEQIEIVLSGIDSDKVKLFLDYDYIDRRVTVHRAVIGKDYKIIGSAILVFDGRLDQPRMVENFQTGTADLSVSASSHWSDFESTAGRHTNATEQKLLHTGDTFFDFTTDTQKDVKWGKE